MRENRTKLLFVTIAICLFTLLFGSIYADTSDWWSAATGFFSGTDWRGQQDNNMLSELKNIIKMGGNAIFLIVTVLLGIKYMASSAEGKGDVKEGLTGLIIAIVLFYGWTAIDNILTRSGGSFDYWFGTNDAGTTITNIYGTIVSILNYVAVGVLIFVGVKYLFAGAEGKADLKGRGVPFVIGLVMTFATISFLNFLIGVVGDFIQ